MSVEKRVDFRLLFLSSNTQDFIEVDGMPARSRLSLRFLSSNTQDFIEVCTT